MGGDFGLEWPQRAHRGFWPGSALVDIVGSVSGDCGLEQPQLKRCGLLRGKCGRGFWPGVASANALGILAWGTSAEALLFATWKVRVGILAWSGLSKLGDFGLVRPKLISSEA